jgi:hypothetical protein
MFDLSENRFMVLALWLCAGAALWLLLSPAAFERRARTRLVEQLKARNDVEWRYNVVLENYRYGLKWDPSVLEMEARRLGYGRPGERTYVLSAEEIRAQEAMLKTVAAPNRFRQLGRETAQAVLPTLLLIVMGIVALLFFAGLRIDDPGAATSSGGPRAAQQTDARRVLNRES